MRRRTPEDARERRPDGVLCVADRNVPGSMTSFDSASRSALDERTRPLFFAPKGAEGRSLFGWYHPPEGERARGPAIVVCPPIGYEGICAYPALRTFAERLAAAGHPVLRFDYDGTGDSAGLDTDPHRVRSWIASVGSAIEEVRALSGVDDVCLFGVRMGATIALLAGAEREDVARIVAWNPSPSGRAYVRELKVFRLVAEESGELTARPRPEGDESEESGGFLLTAETIRSLKALDLHKLARRPADRALVIARDDVPADEKLARALEALGTKATFRQLPGFAAMMVAPHKSVFPEAVHGAIVEWLGDGTDGPARRSARPTSTAQPSGLVASEVREEVIRFGEGGGYFAILTMPDAGLDPKKPLLVFSNTAGNYRVGPNRMYVAMARKLAALGFTSARIDVSGIGDSVIWKDEAENHPYADRLVTDVRALIQHLKAEKRAERFGVAGLCSGAFVAYHAGIADPAVTSIVLINPQTFKWEEGMSLDVNPLTRRDKSEYYKRRLFAKDAWVKMLKGGVDPKTALRAIDALRGRVVDTARSRTAKVLARLPGAAARGSDVARAFDAMCARGVDVLIVFAANDPGIDNLNVKVGASMRALTKRPNFTVTTIDGPDHSFTPIWAQEELEKVVVGHLRERFARG